MSPLGAVHQLPTLRPRAMIPATSAAPSPSASNAPGAVVAWIDIGEGLEGTPGVSAGLSMSRRCWGLVDTEAVKPEVGMEPRIGVSSYCERTDKHHTGSFEIP